VVQTSAILLFHCTDERGEVKIGIGYILLQERKEENGKKKEEWGIELGDWGLETGD
jgi:hypothetical protein